MSARGGSVGPLVMGRLLFRFQSDVKDAMERLVKVMAETEDSLRRCESPGEAQSLFIHCLHSMRECIAQMDIPCKHTLQSLGVEPEVKKDGAGWVQWTASDGKDNGKDKDN